MRPRATVKAVWDSDVSKLLDGLDLLEPIEHGAIHCAFCEREVTVDNLGAVFGRNGAVLISCEDGACVRRATSDEVMSAGG